RGPVGIGRESIFSGDASTGVPFRGLSSHAASHLFGHHGAYGRSVGVADVLGDSSGSFARGESCARAGSIEPGWTIPVRVADVASKTRSDGFGSVCRFFGENASLGVLASLALLHPRGGFLRMAGNPIPWLGLANRCESGPEERRRCRRIEN